MGHPKRAKPHKLSSRPTKPIRAIRNNNNATNNIKATKSNPATKIEPKGSAPKMDHTLKKGDSLHKKQNNLTNEKQNLTSFETRM